MKYMAMLEKGNQASYAPCLRWRRRLLAWFGAPVLDVQVAEMFG